MSKNINEKTEDTFITMDQIPQYFPAFTKGSVKWMRRHRETNGFNQCCRKIGKKVVVSVKAFEKWVNDQK